MSRAAEWAGKGEDMEIGQMMRAQRLRMRLSQTDLAQQCDISVAAVRRLEAGQDIPREVLLRLANILRLSENDLAQIASSSERSRMEAEPVEKVRFYPSQDAAYEARFATRRRDDAPPSEAYYGQTPDAPRRRENDDSQIRMRDFYAEDAPARRARTADDANFQARAPRAAHLKAQDEQSARPNFGVSEYAAGAYEDRVVRQTAPRERPDRPAPEGYPRRSDPVRPYDRAQAPERDSAARRAKAADAAPARGDFYGDEPRAHAF